MKKLNLIFFWVLLQWVVLVFVQSHILIPADQFILNISHPDHSPGYHMAVIQGASSTFRISLRDNYCHLEKLSSLANHHNCIYGINGGPFSSYIFGGCVGLVIADGEPVTNSNENNKPRRNILGHEEQNLYMNDQSISFGLTYSNDWIIGNIPLELSTNIKELITGLNNAWLVFNSTVPMTTYDDHRAPRTAIGVKSSGELVLLQVDGCEHCWTRNPIHRGATLKEIAAELIAEGVSYAINLDGGGSSSTFHSGRIVSSPTCLDYVDITCERPIASAICIGVK